MGHRKLSAISFSFLGQLTEFKDLNHSTRQPLRRLEIHVLEGAENITETVWKSTLLFPKYFGTHQKPTPHPINCEFYR